MFYTYILYCSDKRLYTGYSPNLKNRLKEHINGEVISTKNRRPLELIYYEACVDKFDALTRERYLKSGRGKLYIKSRLRRFLQRSG
jgi:putative endonuclease